MPMHYLDFHSPEVMYIPLRLANLFYKGTSQLVFSWTLNSAQFWNRIEIKAHF